MVRTDVRSLSVRPTYSQISYGNYSARFVNYLIWWVTVVVWVMVRVGARVRRSSVGFIQFAMGSFYANCPHKRIIY